MNTKGVQPPSPDLIQTLSRQYPELARWISLATNASVNARSYSVELAPGTVAANSEAVVTASVTGIRSDDLVFAIKPTRTASVSVMQTIPGTNQVQVVLRNFSAAGIAVPTETYTIFAVRA